MAIPAIGVAVALAGAVQADQSNRSAQRRAKRQGDRQERAVAQAASQERRADVLERQANQRSPDSGSLLTAEQQRASSGPGGTLLTNSRGQRSQTLAQRSSLLG